MKLLFNLDYQTTFGEQLVLNIIGEDGKTESRAMGTRDGYRWSYEFNMQHEHKASSLHYRCAAARHRYALSA